ncbi:EthD family reductase [Agromyces bauzanensis]
MYTIVAIHRAPKDPQAFDEYYENVHIPIVRRFPGVSAIRYGHVGDSTGTDAYLICNVEFPDKAAFDIAAASSVMTEALEDLPKFVTGQLDLHYVETVDHLATGAAA